MNLAKQLPFIIKSILFGLAAAILLLMLRPDLRNQEQTVVSFKEANAHKINLSDNLQIGPVSYASAVEIAAPAVVNVYTTKVITERVNPLFNDPFFRDFFGRRLAPRKRLENSLGSGVIASSSGYILTNNHVIAGADEIQVALRDGRSVQAKLVGSDPESDLAVLKIDLENLPSITFAQSDVIRVGDVVLAIGNPFGVGQTVTMGIISATGRNRLGINTFENFIQTDAAINPGNSGGALINAYGHLIGINTAIFSKSGGSQGIGFAIPLSIASNIMQQIIETGHAIRGWLGIEVQDISPALAESFGLADTKGVIVAGVLRNGPADKMNLRPGDIMTEVDGKAIIDSRSVMNMIAMVKPNSNISVKILRRGKEIILKGDVGVRPSVRKN